MKSFASKERPCFCFKIVALDCRMRGETVRNRSKYKGVENSIEYERRCGEIRDLDLMTTPSSWYMAFMNDKPSKSGIASRHLKALTALHAEQDEKVRCK